MKTLIFTNGAYGDYSFCTQMDDYDYIICADNGMKHARHLGIMPHLIVGDFDSSAQDDLEYFRMQKVSILSFASIKDETDTEIALDKAIEMGTRSVDIFGGIGTRFDHTLANIHLMYKAHKQNVRARLINPQNAISLIDQFIEINGKPQDVVSLLPFDGEVSGIYTTGLGYPLSDGTLTLSKPRGVSNYMVSDTATVTIDKGLLLVIKARD